MTSFFLPDDYLDLGVDDKDAFCADIAATATFAQVQALLADHSLFAPDPDLLAACTYRLASFAREWIEFSVDSEEWTVENGHDSRAAIAKASRLRAEHGRIAILIADFYQNLLDRHVDWRAEANFQAAPDGQHCTCENCAGDDGDDDVSQSELDANDTPIVH